MSRPRFEPFVAIDSAATSSLYFTFHRRRLVLRDGALLDVPPNAIGLPVQRAIVLGRLGDVVCHAAEISVDYDAGTLETVDLRRVFDRPGAELFDLAGRAAQILEWDRTHRFCGVCGGPTSPSTTERARPCVECGHVSFPRVSPAIIVAVERGDEILLARGPAFPPGIYSTLAGFVEPGESVEECVTREVFEETGIEVEDVQYFASQPWPFPHSLMLGFFARYARGEISPQPGEIEDARFFHVDSLPATFSSRISISSWLLDEFRRRRGRGGGPSPD